MPDFYYTGGSQTFALPLNQKYLVEMWGAEGRNGGRYGYAYAILQHTSNVNLYFYVGGSTAETGNPYSGGYNGGGSGGNVGGATYNTYRGFGGGGATDIRTSTSTTSVQNLKILVAGGSGGGLSTGVMGGGAEEDGFPYPQNVDSDGTKYQCGGQGATSTRVGSGGTAPYRHTNSDTSSDTYYAPSGGGGGGGYYGGGGGSSGYVHSAGSARTFGSGSSGNSNGTGGNGGSYTTAVSGWGIVEGGCGGGGSNFIRTDHSYIKGGGTGSVVSGYVPDKPISEYHGFARAYPILSVPEIRGIYRQDEYIYVDFGKSLDNNTEEIFYLLGSFDGLVTGGLEMGRGDCEKISSSKSIIKKYKINFNSITTSGEQVFTASITNGETTVQMEYRFKVSVTPPTVSFNEKNLDKKLLQGESVSRILNVETPFEEIDYLTQVKMIIDGEEYPYIHSFNKGDIAIQLPYLYDGKNKQVYGLKLKARACQKESSPNGNNKDIWSDWIESKEYLVYAISPQTNNIKFASSFKNKAIEKSTKIRLSWYESQRRTLTNKKYRVILYENDKVIQYMDTYDTYLDFVLDYPENKHYRFGVSILIDEFLSEVVYSDEFYLTNINTDNKILLSNELNLTTSVVEDFNRIEIVTNDDTRFISTKNINEVLPIWYFKNGDNDVVVRIYANDKNYISHLYNVYVAYDEQQLNPKKIVDITSTCTINGIESEEYKLKGQIETPIDLSVAEKEMIATGINNGQVIEEIVQKITVTKVDKEENFNAKIIELLGVVE